MGDMEAFCTKPCMDTGSRLLENYMNHHLITVLLEPRWQWHRHKHHWQLSPVPGVVVPFVAVVGSIVVPVVVAPFAVVPIAVPVVVAPVAVVPIVKSLSHNSTDPQLGVGWGKRSVL